MKSILILCRNEERDTFDSTTTYRANMAQISAKCAYTYATYENLIFYYDGQELHILLEDMQTDVSSFDVIFLVGWFKTKILEDAALAVSHYAIANNVKVMNQEALFTRSRSKLSQYVIAQQNGVTMVPFLFCINGEILDKAVETMWNTYPAIVKGALSARGNDNYLIHDQADLRSKLSLANGSEGPWFVVQPYVPNDGDYRVLVMGEEVRGVIHRRSQNESHLNNTSKGGKAQLQAATILPGSVREQCVRLSKALRRDVSGIDLIQHKETGEYYLLESNNMPQLATGSFVGDKLSLLDDYFSLL